MGSCVLVMVRIPLLLRVPVRIGTPFKDILSFSYGSEHHSRGHKEIQWRVGSLKQVLGKYEIGCMIVEAQEYLNSQCVRI